MAFTWSTPISRPKERSGKPIDHHRILELHEVPVEWFSGENLRRLGWNNEKLQLPEDLHPLLRELRGSDAPDFHKSKTPVKVSGSCPVPRRPGRGSIAIELRDQRTEYGGQLTADEPGGRVQWSIQMESQLPSITLRYKEDTRTYRIVFFGHQAMTQVTFHGSTSLRAGVECPTIPERHVMAAREERLMAISLDFKDCKAEKLLDSISILHDEPDDRWKSVEEMIATFEKPNLEGFDEQVRRILIDKDLRVTFFRECSEKEKPNFHHWVAEYYYWQYLMRLASSHGQCWFYNVHRNNPENRDAQLVRWDQENQVPPVPFWLITRFRAQVSDRKLTGLEPIEWKPILPLPTVDNEFRAVLTPTVAAYLRKLGLLRAKRWRERGLLKKTRANDPDNANEVGPCMHILFKDADWQILAMFGHTCKSLTLGVKTGDVAWPTPAESSAPPATDTPATASSTQQPVPLVCSWCFESSHGSLDCSAQITSLEHDIRQARYFREHPLTRVCDWCFERNHERVECTSALSFQQHAQRRERWERNRPEQSS